MSTHVRLYVRPGCHLCEQAIAELARLQRTYPHALELVDISQSQARERRYGERIPVLVVGGREYSAPLLPAELERALAATAASERASAEAAKVACAEPNASGAKGGRFSGAPDGGVPGEGDSTSRDRGDSGNLNSTADDNRAAGNVDRTSIAPEGGVSTNRVWTAIDDGSLRHGGSTAIDSNAASDSGSIADESGALADRGGISYGGIRRGSAKANTDVRPSRNPLRHWLASLNVAVATFLLGALAAPALAALGWSSAAGPLYAAYHWACHQWAFRSFFLFGPQPLVVYDQQQLQASGVDAFSFAGNADFGWKLAICERDLAIYLSLLVVGLLYARQRKHFRELSLPLYGLLILPIALNGFTQLFGWRESTWELRVFTGALFGLASGWLVLPRLDASFGLERAVARYAPVDSCPTTAAARQSLAAPTPAPAPAPAPVLKPATAPAPVPVPVPVAATAPTLPEPQLSPRG